MKSKKLVKKATCNFITLMTILVLVLASCTSKPKLIGPVVETQNGLVQGVANETGTVMAFKGVPYAAPPVGVLRWKEPQPPLPWEGIRDASEFCASCMQNLRYSHLPDGPWTEEFMVLNDVSEDCLFLNIWTPAKKATDKLATLVYIHGGGFNEGSGAIDVYNGEELAKKGIIVITINYRMGALGLLAHPELTAESPENASGNYGILDQVAALRWVRDNITAFGGDPGRVTIAGQSAGARSVRTLIVSPLAKGLFSGAITQSGSGYTGSENATRLSDAEANGLRFAEAKGATSLADLRAMPAEDILAQVPGQWGIRFGIVVDNYSVTSDYMSVFKAGKQNDTPFMTGLNEGEVRYGGEISDAFFALYPLGPDQDTSAVVTIAAQERSRLNAFLWMEYRSKTSRTDGYIYYFDRAIPWPEYPQFGAFHTGEVPYVFNNLKMLDRPWTAVDTLVADQMSTYWVNFVKTGDPNAKGLPEWRPFSSNDKTVMELGEKMGMIPVAETEERYEFLRKQIVGNN
jgi:para-nitrobenzyl esterase